MLHTKRGTGFCTRSATGGVCTGDQDPAAHALVLSCTVYFGGVCPTCDGPQHRVQPPPCRGRLRRAVSGRRRTAEVRIP
ncbi:MAG TPA: hypothetical protein VEI83_01805 [Acidimicrobiales bacterium]|nr:hypothetical protein [Acidimicrobiales bacterium]